jgi:vitamin B12 transporter
MKLSPLALAIALASPAAFAANENPRFDEQLKLPAVVVTASRQAEAVDDTSASVSVFTRADIERLQPSTVSDLLRIVPGVQSSVSGGKGSVNSLFIRGTALAQSLVLVDGQRIGTASAGAAALETLSVEQIERIEVLRGPRSAIYGSDAMGGVVQIFTRRAKGQGLTPRVRVAYGSNQSWERSAGVSGGNQDTRFSLNASSEDTNGINRTVEQTGPDRDRDAFRNNSLSFTLSHYVNDRLETGLSTLHQRGETETDLSQFGNAYPYDEFELSNYSGFLQAHIGDHWETRLELGYHENHNINLHDDTPAKTFFITKRHSATWLNSLHLDEHQTLRVGADWHEDRLDSSSPMTEDTRWNQAAFIQHQLNGEVFATELGLRYDDNEQFGNQTTGSAALTFSLNERNALVASYSQGFRAPTFNDLYYPDSGNPNLSPEESETYELKWRSLIGQESRLEVALYQSDIDDAIIWAPAPTPSDPYRWTPQNISSARVKGLETSLSTSLAGWQAQLALSLLNAEDADSGKQLPRRAKETLSLDLDREFGSVSVGATWLVIGSSYDDADNARQIAGKGLLNLRSAWQINKNIQLAFKVDNALDKQYTNALYAKYDPITFMPDYYPYQEEGRTALLSLTWTPSL